MSGSMVLYREVLTESQQCVLALQQLLAHPRSPEIRVIEQPELTGSYNAQLHHIIDGLVMTDDQRAAFQAQGPRAILNVLVDIGLSDVQVECVQLAYESWKQQAAAARPRRRAYIGLAVAGVAAAALLVVVAVVVAKRRRRRR